MVVTLPYCASSCGLCKGSVEQRAMATSTPLPIGKVRTLTSYHDDSVITPVQVFVIGAVLFTNHFGQLSDHDCIIIYSISILKIPTPPLPSSNSPPGMNMVQPFIPFMIQDFYPTLNSAQLGTSKE